MKIWEPTARDLVALWHAYERDQPGSGWERLARYMFKLRRDGYEDLPEDMSMGAYADGPQLHVTQVTWADVPYVQAMLQQVPQKIPYKEGVAMVIVVVPSREGT